MLTCILWLSFSVQKFKIFRDFTPWKHFPVTDPSSGGGHWSLISGGFPTKESMMWCGPLLVSILLLWAHKQAIGNWVLGCHWFETPWPTHNAIVMFVPSFKSSTPDWGYRANNDSKVDARCKAGAKRWTDVITNCTLMTNTITSQHWWIWPTMEPIPFWPTHQNFKHCPLGELITYYISGKLYTVWLCEEWLG